MSGGSVTARAGGRLLIMSGFTLQITLRHGGGDTLVTARLAGPRPWSALRPLVCRAVGLDEATVLHHGIGPVEDSWIVGSPPLLTGCVVSTTPGNRLATATPLVVSMVAGPDAGLEVPVGSSDLMVGRAPDADVVVTDPAVSWRHAHLAPVATGLAVRDLGSTNGVVVDGEPADDRTVAATGSVIRLGNTVAQLRLTTEPAGSFRPDGAGHLVLAGPHSPVVDGDPPELPGAPAEPQPPPRRALPVISALMGAGIGIGLAVGLHNPMYLAFAAFGPVTMVATAVGDRLQGRRSFRRARRQWRADRQRYVSELRAAVSARRRDAWLRWPGPGELVRRAETTTARLWTEPRGGPLRAVVGSAVATLDGVAVADMPVVVELRGVVGFSGPAGRAVARHIVSFLACGHPPRRLRISVVCGRNDLAPCRLLPHADPAGGPTDDALRTVMVLDGPRAYADPVGARALAASAAPGAAEAGRLVVLCLADDPGDLPPQARDFRRAHAAAPEFIPICAAPASLARVAAALAPLRDGAATRVAPEDLDLSALIGPVTAESLREWWATPAPCAVVGAAGPAAMTLDLEADGPHLLIAGTTGSGKSELLTTLITSLATTSPPQALTFLLVDYKGGAAFAAVADLPHVVGVVTDLDAAGSARALASLRAEVRYRERHFAEPAASATAPARLVVVIDEFATLAAELPEFLAGLVDIAQRGRSLGLHLVLATQRPAGVVSPAMRANISTRICLRVTDPAESIDVVGVPDAASIPASSPGSAIVRASSGTATMHVARVSVPRRPDIAVTVTERRPSRPASVPPPAGGGAPATRTTIVEEVIAAARAAAAGSPPVRRPWSEPLPQRVAAPPDRPRAWALVDLPDEQRQDLVDAPEASLLVVGPPGRGCSTALRAVAAAGAAAGHELIVLDGAGGLRDLSRWPAVSTYLDLREPQLILRVLSLLSDPARRPHDGHLRHVIVDHLDLVAAELDRADYVAGPAALTELMPRGGATVRISAGGPDRLRHQRIAAGLSEVVDLGATAAGGLPGRGRWRGHLVQLVERTVGACPPSPAPSPAARTVVRPLPRLVSRADLPAATPSAVPVGLGGDRGEPVTLDLTGPGGGILVAGPRGAGVTTALRTIATQAAAAGITVMVADSGTAAPLLPGTAAIDCRTGTTALRRALRAHDGPIVLVADLGAAGSDTAAAEFAQFLRVCGPGQFLLVGARITEVVRSRRGVLHEVASHRRGILLAPEAGDAAVMDATVPRRTSPRVPGRGVWVNAGATIPVQLCGEGGVPRAPSL